MAERVVGKDRDPKRTRRPKPDPAVKVRAEALVGQGMPYQMAMAVAHGRIDLNEALERMARKDRVTALMERHTLSRALATQIALGQADIEQVLARRRLDDHRRTNRDRSCLQVDARLVLQLADPAAAKGRVLAVEPFQFQFERDGGTPELIHKLRVVYAYAPDDWKGVKKAIKTDKNAVQEAVPATRPQDRYSCSDRRLFGYMDHRREVAITLLDGVTMRGMIAWFGRYEFGLTLRTDVEITVFRHAMKQITPISADGSA